MKFEDYRVFFRTKLLEKKEKFGNRFTFERMAEACGVQKTYLSRVLNGDGHLSADQIFLSAKYLGLSEDELALVNLLHDFEKSTISARKEILAREIERCRSRLMKTEEHIHADRLSTNENVNISEYYLDVHTQLVHMFLSIPKYATKPSEIAKEMQVAPDEIAKQVAILERMGIVRAERGRYRVLRDSVHLSTDSPIYKTFRVLQRLKTCQRLQSKNDERDYSFSVAFSADEDTREKIQQAFLKFISEMEPKVKNAPAKQVFQMNFDLFGWG